MTFSRDRSGPGWWLSATAHALLGAGVLAFVDQTNPESAVAIPIELLAAGDAEMRLTRGHGDHVQALPCLPRACSEWKGAGPEQVPFDRFAPQSARIARSSSALVASERAPPAGVERTRVRVDDLAKANELRRRSADKWGTRSGDRLAAAQSLGGSASSQQAAPGALGAAFGDRKVDRPAHDPTPASGPVENYIRSVDQVRVRAKVERELFKLDVDGTAVEKSRGQRFNDPDFNVFERGARERNQVADLKVIVSTPGDGLKFTLRESESVYAADPQILKKKPWIASQRGRLFDLSATDGRATHKRLDVFAYKSDWFDVTGHAAHIETDGTFERFALVPTGGKTDEFSTLNRTALVSGGGFRLGPVTLSASHTEAQKLTGPENSSSTSQGYTVTFDLWDLRNRTGQGAEPLWAVLPTSIYGGYADTSNNFKLPEKGAPDQTGVYNLGAAWGGQNLYGSLNYYNYRLDSRRVLEASYDSAGQGFSANLGFWARQWTADGGFSSFRSDELAPLARAKSTSADANFSVTYKPEGLPDVSLGGTIGRYGYESLAWQSRAETIYWHMTATLNFAKFLRPLAIPGAEAQVSQQEEGLKSNFAVKGSLSDHPTLKLLYRLKHEDAAGFDGTTPQSDHLAGVLYLTPF